MTRRVDRGWEWLTASALALFVHGLAPAPADAAGSAYLDSLGIGMMPPLCIDRDANGLSDAWEEEFLGATGNDPDADDDGDGVTNRDEQIAGTDPKDADSYVRLTAIDLAAPDSDDITMALRSGSDGASTAFGAVGDKNKRQFVIRAADSPTAAKIAIGDVVDDGSGTIAWTDTNMVNTSSHRYYEIAVRYGGNSYTNNEEWAAYVQTRTDGHTDLVSLPVDLGDDNTLSGAAGRQLARGLHAGSSTNDSDRIILLSGEGLWKAFSLVTNAAGDELWWDFSNGRAADERLSAGVGFWVERKAGSPRVRSNAVFVGRSFTHAPALEFRTNHAANGWAWTVFGWPFSSPDRQVNSGIGATPANQLSFNFAAGAVGGSTARTTRPHESKGDQIWVWDGRRYVDTYWLMQGVGADFDGRWWNNRTMTFADIRLEAGKAYLYRRHVSTNGIPSGTNFWWNPSP